MGRFPWAASVVVASILMGGCSTLFGSNDSDLSQSDAESSAPPPSPQPIPTLPPTPNPILIPPTDPNQRLRTLKGGRPDPFQSLGPSTKAPASPSQGSTNDSSDTAFKAYTGFLDRVGDQFEQRLSPPTKKSPAGASTTTPGQTTTARSSNSKPRVPVRPQPNTARGVQVTGVILVEGVPRAIVKAPGEPVSRSVRRGECLARGGLTIVSQPISPKECLRKGRVLVKQINVNQSEPVVILEQYGTEVALRVGKPSS